MQKRAIALMATLLSCAAQGTFAAEAIHARTLAIDSSGKLVTVQCTADSRIVSGPTVEAAAALCTRVPPSSSFPGADAVAGS